MKEILKDQQVGSFSVRATIINDPDCINPNDDCDCVGKIYAAHSQYEFDKIVAEHRHDPLALKLERYSHGGDVYALAGEGNFPDRQWDVSPFVGYIVPDDELRKWFEDKKTELGIDAAMAALKTSLEADIETYNTWLSGDCWGYTVTSKNHITGVVHEHDSCWGFIGRDSVEKEALSSFDGVVKKFETALTECGETLPTDEEAPKVSVCIDEGGVYLYGEDSEEIVMWNTDEMKEAPEEVAFAIAGALKMLYEDGGNALRKFIKHPDAKE